MGGKFTMSDDSHGIAQVATNYGRAAEYLTSLGVEDVWTFKRVPHAGLDGEGSAKLEDVRVPLQLFRQQFKIA
jgi:histidinol-phosphatase (PHP family)